MRFATVTIILLVSIIGCSWAEQCGRQAGGAQCPGGTCCSKY
ncbi:class I chitinase, partial [Trifolium medium]|nr:class I chitinase [Trifolium medium]